MKMIIYYGVVNSVMIYFRCMLIIVRKIAMGNKSFM
jgi:hypothetical protein